MITTAKPFLLNSRLPILPTAHCLTITNTSNRTLSSEGWALYFNSCRKTRPGSVTGGVDIVHINGDLSKLAPTAEFNELKPGESRTISYVGLLWVIQATDAPLGFYIVYDDGTPDARAEAIGDPEIAPFVSLGQRNRKPGDVLPCITPALRYQENAATTLLPPSAIGRITPSPLKETPATGEFLINSAMVIVHTAELKTEANLLQKSLAALGIVTRCASEGHGIQLRLGKIEIDGIHHSDEAYRLDITRDGIVIIGASAHGVFNGIQSLRQLFPIMAWHGSQNSLAVPLTQVIDSPRFEYRGMHLDVGRNFSSKETILRMLDVMALYKLNKFHFHITDDEGWRIEIPSLPELTEIGSKRGFTQDERDHLVPSFGSGAKVEGSHGTGFYSKADFIEILRFATERHIEVIPEIDVPGHARAAIKAMETRYFRLKAQGKDKAAEEYLLTDFDDTSVYESVQLWHDNVVCIAKESCYRFIDTVVSDIIAMFDEAGAPLRTMQTGGDEIPHGVWEGSPLCQKFMAEHRMQSIQELLNYFLGRFSGILKEHGLVMAGWEEIALTKEKAGDKEICTPNPAFIGANFRPYVWNNLWGMGQEDFAYKLANAGYEIVLSNVTNLYFDLAYEKDPDEPGYYWGGFLPTRKPFEFCPLDIYTTTVVDGWGKPLDPAMVANLTQLTPEGRKNILGIQGQIWGENARSNERVEHFFAPRAIALAERAWAADPGWTSISDKTQRDAKINADWNSFANRLGQRELPRLDSFLGGYGYRIPVPGAKIIDGTLHANISMPGTTIRYTSDGSQPSTSSPVYQGPVAVSGSVKLAAFTSTGRRGRVVTAV